MSGLAPRITAWACCRRALLKLASPFSFFNVAIQQSGSSYPLSLLKHASSGVVHLLSASFMTSSMVRLARCKILVSAQLIGWSFTHACSAMADLSVRYLVQASLCSLGVSLAGASFLQCTPYRRCMVPRRRRSIARGSLTLGPYLVHISFSSSLPFYRDEGGSALPLSPLSAHHKIA